MVKPNFKSGRAVPIKTTGGSEDNLNDSYSRLCLGHNTRRVQSCVFTLKNWQGRELSVLHSLSLCSYWPSDQQNWHLFHKRFQFFKWKNIEVKIPTGKCTDHEYTAWWMIITGQLRQGWERDCCQGCPAPLRFPPRHLLLFLMGTLP